MTEAVDESVDEDEVAYHLLLTPPEATITARALHLLISDEAHEADIRALARAVIERLETEPPDGEIEGVGETRSVALSPQEMKITHTAVKLLLLDTRREQESERQLLWSIVEKLPDDHAIRAIELD